MKAKQIKKVSEPLEVIEPFKPEVIKFTNTEDFNTYYSKHADEFTDLTTQKLNIKYKIPGYRLTKKQGELKLMKDYYQKPEEVNSPATNLEARVALLERKLQEISDYLQSIN